MEHPSQLFERIRRQKARPALARQGRGGVAPAPVRPAPAPAIDAPAPPTHAPYNAPAPQARPPVSDAYDKKVSRAQGVGGDASGNTASRAQGFVGNASSSPIPTTQPFSNNIPAGSGSPQPDAPTRPARGHALYSQVMRSHDRMGTRHL